MIDADGVEWLTVAQVVERLSVQPATVRQWVARGKVAGHLVHRRLWVSWPDVLDAERATRGAFLAQRGRRVSH